MDQNQDLHTSFTREQVNTYLDRLEISSDNRHSDVRKLDPDAQLAFLQLLQRRHLLHIPFENLSLHYSPHRYISLHPQELFGKILAGDNPRGGYCMENNRLFAALLYSLGYEIYSVGAKVYKNGPWTGWSHMVNIVIIDGRKYHVDVGFGGNGPVIPMKLCTDAKPQPQIAPSSVRMRYGPISGNLSQAHNFWHFEHRFDDEAEFQPIYCFVDLEFQPADFEVMSYYVSTHAKTFFTRIVVIEKKLSESGSDELIGHVSIWHDKLKVRIHGKVTTDVTLKSEAERIAALKQHFGIEFSVSEIDGIKGMASELLG